MPDSPLIVGGKTSAPPARSIPIENMAKVAMAFGVLFLLSGAVDLVVGFSGANLGDPRGRFVALSAAASALPLLAIAFLLLLGGGVAGGRMGWVRFFAALGCLLSLVVLAGVVALVLSRGAVAAQTPPSLLGTVNKSLVRSALFGVLIAGGIAVSSVASIRYAMRPSDT